MNPMRSRYSTESQCGASHDGSHEPRSSSNVLHGPDPSRRNSVSAADSPRWTLHRTNGSRPRADLLAWKSAGGRQAAAHPRELEMRVRVHQAGQQCHGAQIDFPFRWKIAWTRVAERDDAAPFGQDPAVPDGRLGDWKHPRGSVLRHSGLQTAHDPQSAMPLCCFPDRLLAGYRLSSSGTLVSPSSRAVARLSMRGTSRSRKIGSPSTS